MATVELNPREATVHQLAQAVADTPGVHGKPYEAMLLLKVDGLNNADTRKKIDGAFTGVKGVKAATIVDEKNNILGVSFDKLEASAAPGVRLGPIRTALRNAGLTAELYAPEPPKPAQP